jgi:tetratricopeptide (TPR) repeat protein
VVSTKPGQAQGDATILSKLENSRGLAASSQGRYDEAIQSYEKALTLKRSEVGSEHLEYAIVLLNLSDALKGANRLAEALAASDETLTAMLPWLGPDHIEVGMAKSNRGDLFVALNRTKDALASYADALAIYRATLLPGDSRFTYALGGTGIALLQNNDARGAHELLEQAVRMNMDDRFFAAELNFALARALRADKGDRVRAIELARVAAAAYEGARQFDRRRSEILEWIASEETPAVGESPTPLTRVRRRAD